MDAKEKQKPALNGGKPVRETPLLFARPSIGEEEIASVCETLRSGWLTTGPKTKLFEQKFGQYVGAANSIAVNSCTAALHVSLAALGVGAGDEVITTPLTFTSTANVAVHLGAKPVFADIDETGNIDPQKIAKAITSNTKAIIPVHYSGAACDMDAIMRLANEKRIAVVEDAAHAAGTEYKHKRIGSLQTASACFSFYATKNLATGEGGMICTPDAQLAAKMRRLALHGMSKDAWNRYTDKGSWYYEITEAGFKDNMTDIAAAIGLEQLAKLDAMNAQREKIASQYNTEFSKIPELKIPVVKSFTTKHSWHLYPLRLELGKLKANRAQFIDALKTEGILASVHFIPVHLHPFYRNKYGFKPGDFPNAEAFYNAEVSLPLFPSMTQQDTQDVIDAVKKLASWYSK